MKKTTTITNPKLADIFVMSVLAAENFRLFVSEVMSFNNAPFHNELDDMLSSPLNRMMAVAWPRGFGKTSHISIAYPLWEIARDHNKSILLVSSTADVSRLSLAKITEHIEQNKKYRLWSRLIDPKKKGVQPKLKARQKREQHWGSDSIIIDREDIRPRDATITAVGLFGPILSKRADIVILDDVVNQENSATEDQRAKIKDWIYTTVLPVLLPGGRVICLGNTWHMDDLMNNLLKDPQFDIRKRMPAIIHEATRQNLWEEWANIYLNSELKPEGKKEKADALYAEHKAEMDEGIELLWPERFSYPNLYMKRISNQYSFARMYQCDPSIRPNQKFTEEDIKRAMDKGKDMILQDESREEFDGNCTASGLDLAISMKDSADDTVLLTLDQVKYGSGDIKAGDYVIRNIERGKFPPEEIVERVRQHYYRVNPTAIRVESNGYQEMMVRDLGEYGIPITSYKTGGEKNDPEIGVHSLAVLMSQGKLVIPNGNDARTRQLVAKLINELRAYPDGHTGDSLMALWFAFSEIRDYTAQKFVTPSTGSFIPPSTSPQNEAEADRELINKQERARGGYDPARALLERAQEAERIARERIKNEEKDVFNELMRRRRGY